MCDGAGESSGEWSVDLPAEEVPSELPEPCLGINFARCSEVVPAVRTAFAKGSRAAAPACMLRCSFCRDGMQKKDWLRLVAAHSDAWLYSVAFYYGAKLKQQER